MQDERRRSARREETFLVSILTTMPIEITGETVNFSSHGVLLRAYGERLSVLLRLKGKQYRARLVRAVPRDPKTTEYAIELEEALEFDADPVP